MASSARQARPFGWRSGWGQGVHDGPDWPFRITGTCSLAGPALYGTYGVADFVVDANPASKAFSERYQAADKAAPDMNPAWAYDAVHLLARAIQDAGSTGPERIRSALLVVWGHMDVEGGYSFDANDDGLHGYNVVRNDGGELVFVRRVDPPAG